VSKPPFDMICVTVDAAMQLYNTAEWLPEDFTSSEMGMHAIILLVAIHSMDVDTIHAFGRN
jgi:hypothetical protein